MLLMGLVCSDGAWAWGAEGHRLIAEYAGKRLSLAARTQIDRLLALEPGATLASVSTWADEVRSPTTAAWQFLNFPRDADCHYDGDRVCIQGNCVVGAIERQLAVRECQKFWSPRRASAVGTARTWARSVRHRTTC